MRERKPSGDVLGILRAIDLSQKHKEEAGQVGNTPGDQQMYSDNQDESNTASFNEEVGGDYTDDRELLAAFH